MLKQASNSESQLLEKLTLKELTLQVEDDTKHMLTMTMTRFGCIERAIIDFLFILNTPAFKQ